MEIYSPLVAGYLANRESLDTNLWDKYSGA